ncbi:ATP-binding protein [Rhodococcus qingshengii]|uniref:ATP-binding protein n=1 Tax=Rhodococcus qingshengii TaxID=334542 RepID=UPI00301818C8
MGEYLIPVHEVQGNLIYTEDGHIFANYLLEGINISKYRGESITNGQERNKELFKNLSMIPSPDMLLWGIKVRTDPERLIARVSRGLPPVSDSSHPALTQEVTAFYEGMMSGEFEEFDRLYILSVEIPTSAAGTVNTVSKMSGTDPFATVDRRWVADYEKDIFSLLPASFEAERTTPHLLDWAHERMRTRGISVPVGPLRPRDRRANPDATEDSRPFSRKGFAPVVIDKVADTRPVFDEFLKALNSGSVKATPKRYIKRFMENFNSVRYGQQIAVYSPDQRTESLPDGPASYQTLMAIDGWPTKPKKILNSFTFIVDQELGVDADFALRFSFSQAAISLNETRKFLKTLDFENQANSEDEFDAIDYGNRGRERRLLQHQTSEESAPRGMEVTAIFAFAHPNRAKLVTQVRAVRDLFEENGFAPTFPVGGQFELLKMMLPGSSCTQMGNELKGTTTVHAFSACLPIRKSFAGDEFGLPIAVNKENALGQVILRDYFGATEGGGGSIVMTGEPGSGKTYYMKKEVGFMSDLHLPAWILDQSEHAEWAVFAQQLGEFDVIDVMDPEYSLDPLKVLPPEEGGQLFIDSMLPLLNLRADSAEAELLGNFLKPSTRQLHSIGSSRDLITALDKAGGAVGKDLARSLRFWGGQRYARSFFDPVGEDGRVRNLPPFRPNLRTVVFRTHGLTVYKGEVRPDTAASKIFGTMLFTAIAAYTAYVFSQTRLPCHFIADEVSFLSGTNVLEDLVKSPDRVGRKAANSVVAGAQLVKDVQDGNYDLARTKIIFRQSNEDNAIAALVWIGIPPTATMVQEMTTNTSPGDKKNNNKPLPGREGEGWMRDGSGTIVRIKVLPQMNAKRHKYADTTASSMIRIGDLPSLEKNGSHV